MTTDNAPVTLTGPQLTMVWSSMLLSPVMISLFFYFFGKDFKGISGLPADYDTWFLAGGLATAFISLPLMRRFRDATRLKRGAVREAAEWQRIHTTMMTGIAVAELPFFIGIAGYLTGGFTQTAAILLFVTLALQFRFKPPAR